MKIVHLMFVASSVMLAGCAGYNTTMFMTKSNAGLDFDAKPPTAEISISRKEAVIAPAFEGGQTPPVIASFKPHTGLGSGFANFFVGVDQTFAGGDAAVTMAFLFASTNLPAPGDGTNYSSTLKLTKKPAYKDVFREPAEPGKIRPFIFGTDTSLGLKVAWSGAGGQIPDTVKLGFNRKEFAWAPITMSTNAQDTNAPYHVKMPSFLATIQSKIEVSTNETGITALQYFATGDAATGLALQPAVRQAMIARIDPVAAALAKTLEGKFNPESQARADCIRAWLNEDFTNHNQMLTGWMKTNNIPGHPSFWLGTGTSDQFNKAIQQFNIPCP